MNKTGIRIQSIKIRNLKNVRNGQINLTNNHKNFNASVLGLYGQNGSGKTAMIDALGIIKKLLTGLSLPKDTANYITNGQRSMELSVQFLVHRPHGLYTADYTVYFKKNDDSMGEPDSPNPTLGFTLLGEKIVYSYNGKLGDSRKAVLINTLDNPGNTMSSPIFLPTTKFKKLVRKDSEAYRNLIGVKRVSVTNGTSFIFSQDFLQEISKTLEENPNDTELRRHVDLIQNLHEFGLVGLSVIDTKNTGKISLNFQPILFKYHNDSTTSKKLITYGQYDIPLDGPVTLSDKILQELDQLFDSMNIVLKEIIPGFTVYAKRLGSEVTANGEEGFRIQLVSSRADDDSQEPVIIPLKYESEGIQKIISILHLLIEAFNSSSTTVAVDELDSGIYEYLLGELLKIFSEKGEGQLIFTSHNLRPLETIDPSFIAFTTTDPRDRYTKIQNIQANNNLRDVYVRKIFLNDNPKELYNSSSDAKIALAFIKAGRLAQ